MPYPLHPMDPNDPNYDPKLDPHSSSYNPNDPRLVFRDPTGRGDPTLKRKDPDSVDDPNAFLLNHINQNKSATASDDDVADPDKFLSEHISGKTHTASIGDVSAQPSQRVQGAFEAMSKQPNMVARMYPIKNITDVEGMSKRYGYYLATHPYATLGATAAAPLAGLIAPEIGTGVGAAVGLASRMAPFLGLGETMRGFQDIKSLYSLISGSGE